MDQDKAALLAELEELKLTVARQLEELEELRDIAQLNSDLLERDSAWIWQTARDCGIEANTTEEARAYIARCAVAGAHTHNPAQKSSPPLAVENLERWAGALCARCGAQHGVVLPVPGQLCRYCLAV